MKTICTVRNCNVRIAEPCPKQWEHLDVTNDESVRHCASCGKDVHYCRTDEQTIAHAKAGHCIARLAPDKAELPPVVIGRPTVQHVPTEQERTAQEWASRERRVDEAIKDALSVSVSCPACGYPAGEWRKTCKVCGKTLKPSPT